ncbi:MAG: hypothetical protein M9916_00635 [Crocinitomicaceae bacterium]|nr:hypothetical protein [Crocinitomicaceae bacterium]
MDVYHTQECRKERLKFPKQCVRFDAWLGEAYYFWLEEIDAYDWGQKSKRRTNYFEIYKCDIESENFLDTVFNEEHYYFWIRQLEKIAKKIMIKTGQKPTLKELNDYIRDKADWQEVDYIKFQDLPISSERSLVKPIQYKNGKVRTVAFRKRIQIAVYNREIIANFALLTTERIN